MRKEEKEDSLRKEGERITFKRKEYNRHRWQKGEHRAMIG
jgi:hypothetical protein